MTWDEVSSLTRNGTIDIGSHTVNHVSLASLPEQQQHSEIVESKKTLEVRTGRVVQTFSYPYGGRDHYNAATVGIVRAASYKFACSNLLGNVTAMTAPYEIPRIYVEDWDGEEFARRLCLRPK